MSAASPELSQEQVSVAGLALNVIRHGSGEPLVVLHRSTGNLGWGPLQEELSKRFVVYLLDMPGYGRSERPQWARTPRDLAILLNGLLRELDLDGVHLVGLGLGGWVGAEMATMNETRLSSMVLVGPPGLRPREGRILDQMLISYELYARAGFSDDQTYKSIIGIPSTEMMTTWDLSREMTARVTWKPYMTSSQLPHLLQLIQTPTLVVSGELDTVVPVDVARQYAEKLAYGSLEIVPGCGHTVDLEMPETLAALIADHAAAARNADRPAGADGHVERPGPHSAA